MRIELEGETYFDIPELVNKLGVSKKTLYTWIQKKKLKAHRLGRRYLVANAEIRRFIESH